MITAYIAVGSNLADPVSQAMAIETSKAYRDQLTFIATSAI